MGSNEGLGAGKESSTCFQGRRPGQLKRVKVRGSKIGGNGSPLSVAGGGVDAGFGKEGKNKYREEYGHKKSIRTMWPFKIGETW